jgi:hypothetical protein
VEKVYINSSPVARSVPFDNATNGFVSTNVQAAIEEIALTGGPFASTALTWGGLGTITKGSYLLNEAVPSNVAGRIVPLSYCAIREVSVSTENAYSYKLNIQTRSGAIFTTISTVTVTAARTAVFDVNVSVNKGDELAVRVDPTSIDNPKNIVVGLIIKGAVGI